MVEVIEPTSRREVIESMRARGRRVIAVLPYHYPRALLRAHGFHPIEVWGPPGVVRDGGGRHLQAYACDIVVRAASFMVSGGMDPVDAVLVPHTCDSLQGLGSVATDFLDLSRPVLTLYLPRGQRDTDRVFLTDELRRLGDRLAEISGEAPDDAAWEEAFAAEDAADRALDDLYRRRPGLAVSDREFYGVVRSREYLPAGDFVARAGALPVGDPPEGGVGLLLSGIVADPLDLFDRIAEMGARVVADDLACGSRRRYPPAPGTEPFAREAARLLGGPPDPTRGSPIRERADHLIAQIEASGAAGMVVYDVKFCEPELFDIPLLRKHLGTAGYPTLRVEVELGEGPSHRTLTRIEAFVETLR